MQIDQVVHEAILKFKWLPEFAGMRVHVHMVPRWNLLAQGVRKGEIEVFS